MAESGRNVGFVPIDTTREETYVELACQLWVFWSGFSRTGKNGIKGRLTGTVPEALNSHDPQLLRQVERICHAVLSPSYPEQWDETLSQTLTGFAGRQPGQRRDLGLVVPRFLFVPLMCADRKRGAWDWLLIGEALAGAMADETLNDTDRSSVLRRLTTEVRTHREDMREPTRKVKDHLSHLAAGPPKLGVPSLVVLSRIGREPEMRQRLAGRIMNEPPMFRLFRAFTLMLTDAERSLVPIADKVLEIEPAPCPYPARCLQWEALATVAASSPRPGDDAPRDLEVLRQDARKALRRVTADVAATWRERAYAAEAITRPGRPTRGTPTGTELDDCLARWLPELPGSPALSHAAAVLAERQMAGGGLKRAVGAKTTDPVAKATTVETDKASTRRTEDAEARAFDALVVTASARHGSAVADAIVADKALGESVKLAIEAAANRRVVRDDDERLTNSSWVAITRRMRFLCEESVLAIAGTRRRRSVDCLAVAGLADLASDVLLDAVVDPTAETRDEYPLPLWVQELGAWAIGFLRLPTAERLDRLASVGHDHLLKATEAAPESGERRDRVAAAHAALWAIGDAGALSSANQATNVVSDTVKTVLRDVLANGTAGQADLAPVRHAAAYTLRFCFPGEPLPIGPAEDDDIVEAYSGLDIAWLADDGQRD